MLFFNSNIFSVKLLYKESKKKLKIPSHINDKKLILFYRTFCSIAYLTHKRTTELWNHN